MNQTKSFDAVVVGSGPNGLAAAVTLARAGYSVQVREANETIGGGTRSAELTLPGFLHDLCSAVHPLAASSPFFQELPLSEHGLEFAFPPAALAHPFDDGTAVLLERSLMETGETMGRDAVAYRKAMKPFVEDWDELAQELLGPLRMPRHPFKLARFGLQAIRSCEGFAKKHFAGERARGFFAGLAAHSFLPLDYPATAAFGIMLAASGHAIGWPVARGGSQKIADALTSYLRSLGGEVVANARVNSLDDLPELRAVLCDVTPRQMLKLAGERLPAGYRRQLARYRYGPAAFKIDFALNSPIPWKAAECARAATVHLGGTLEEIAASERAAWIGEHSEKPLVLVAQQSLFDTTRAPAGKHTAWAYCHVPHATTFDMSERIENQIERFAPGFRDCVIAKRITTPADLQNRNANMIGGDINGGVQDWRQQFTRPTLSLNPYVTPAHGLYICSSSTPPGGGVHGMCGYHAARAALRKLS